jgi:hypothetical protein
MIFHDSQEVQPRKVGGGGGFGPFDLLGVAGGPMHETEFWNCYFCGKVRAVRQWKRAEILELTNEKKDERLGTWSPDQLRSVDGKDLLPDGWDFHRQEFVHQEQQYKLLMLGCAECMADVDEHTKEGDDADNEDAVDEKEEAEDN